MTKMKRLMAGLLAMLMLATTLPVGSIKAKAETSGDYEYSVNEDGTVKLTKYLGSGGNVTIPSEIDGKKVANIEIAAFYGCAELTEIMIPEGVTSIGAAAFRGCSSLVSVTIPGSVTSVGSNAFEGTKWLEDKKKENPLVVAGHIVIDGTTCSGEVVIPEGVTLIAASAFAGFRNDDGYMMPNRITSVTIPRSMTKIDGWTFSSCPALKSATIPGSVTSIGKEAFGWFLNPENYFKIDGFVIYGESGTAAEQYAEENGFEFRLISGNGPSQGDTSQIDISKAEVTLEKESRGIVCKKTVYNVAYGAKPFTIQASADSALTYESSDGKVASVDQRGKVTVKGTGVAYITVKSSSDSLKITVKASPKKQTVKSAQTAKGRKLTVKWKKDKRATGYQIQISSGKNFIKVIKTIKTPKNACTFTKLKEGSKYYVRLRSYKKSGKNILYGAWSNPKQSGKVEK